MLFEGMKARRPVAKGWSSFSPQFIHNLGTRLHGFVGDGKERGSLGGEARAFVSTSVGTATLPPLGAGGQGLASSVAPINL